MRIFLSILFIILSGAAIAALPSSGTITMADLQTEFGGSNPVAITEYYRGGGLVPDYYSNQGIPTSGQISLSDFHGGSGATPAAQLFTGFATSNEAILPTTTASVIFQTSGQCEYYAPGNSGGTGKSSDYAWVLAGVAEDFDMYVSATGDTAFLTSGTLNTWVRVLNPRSFSLGSEAGTTKTVTLTITVRSAYTLATLAGPVTVVLTTST